jgi:predicted alpha/beta-fold hydrolase
LETADGDFLDLDVGPRPTEWAPVVVVLHGLEGNARRPYVTNACRALMARGIQPVAMNFRGCSGEPNRLARAYHSGETGDLGAVLGHIGGQWPGRRVGLLGFSLGGNVALKLLGELGEAKEAPGPHQTGGPTGARAPRNGGRDAGSNPAGSAVRSAGPPLPAAACAVSVPFDLSAGADALEAGPMGRLYSLYFLRSLRRKLEERRRLLSTEIDLPAALAARTIREFDERVTARLHGFDGAEDYYARSSSLGFLHRIRVPTLLIQSWDDPFLPRSAIEAAAAVSNSALSKAFTERGGHVGFLSDGPRGPERFWAEERAADFLAGRLVTAEGASS